MAEVGIVAYEAGVRDSGPLATAIAIAMAESGGNPRAYNGRGRDDSYGLWQINMQGDLGPTRRQQFGLKSNSELYTPSVNAKAMMQISGSGKSWGPWSTYGGLRYYALLPAAKTAALGVAAGRGTGEAVDEATDIAGGAIEATQQGIGAVLKAGRWMSDRNNWFRVAKVAVGGALIIGGLVAVSRPAIESAVPVGKVLKIARKVAK